jgi:hypothetical protein
MPISPAWRNARCPQLGPFRSDNLVPQRLRRLKSGKRSIESVAESKIHIPLLYLIGIIRHNPAQSYRTYIYRTTLSLPVSLVAQIAHSSRSSLIKLHSQRPDLSSTDPTPQRAIVSRLLAPNIIPFFILRIILQILTPRHHLNLHLRVLRRSS